MVLADVDFGRDDAFNHVVSGSETVAVSDPMGTAWKYGNLFLYYGGRSWVPWCYTAVVNTYAGIPFAPYISDTPYDCGSTFGYYDWYVSDPR